MIFRKKAKSVLNRLRESMGSPVIDCRELRRLIDEMQYQKPVGGLGTERKPQNTFQGGAG